ncbi:MAG TPA: peptide MFS transporter [Holophagaceae bacterium]|jgi:POT family proton-dependent oligopeptide transporter|nr:peptide MFS transporter [Holophagaceae bacterium]
MNLPVMALQVDAFGWRAFTPLIVPVLIWLVAVGYGLFALRDHPKGLRPLFFTEMWERFSYYGMRALLMLYMTLPAAQGGLGFSVPKAGIIYGWYTFLVYAFSVPGGWVADRFTGFRKAVIIGGVLITLGEFGLASGPNSLFYAGLAAICFGTGLLKTNCTSLVGLLYGENDPKQDAGFSIYYMGINIGALVAPLFLGFMAQDPKFVSALSHMGLTSPNGWRWAFGAAGLAMLAGLCQYLLQHKILGDAGLKPSGRRAETHEALPPLTHDEKNRMWVVVILVVFIMTFFFVFEQAGTTLTLFADEHTRCSILGWTFPSSWFQSVNSIWLLILAPMFAWLWVALRHREPSSPAKFTAGLFFVGAGMLILVLPSLAFQANPALKISPWWLVAVYCLHTIGELCLSPVGLSTVSKLAPARYAGLMMGVFFFAIGAGNMLAGLAGSISQSVKPSALFGGLFCITTVMAIVLIALTPRIKKLMGGVN